MLWQTVTSHENVYEKNEKGGMMKKKIYFISLLKGKEKRPQGYYVRAKNYIEASKILKITPYEMRTYSAIMKHDVDMKRRNIRKVI